MANDRTAPGGMGMLLLALLEGRDMYGYEMIEALRARSNEVFHLKAGNPLSPAPLPGGPGLGNLQRRGCQWPHPALLRHHPGRPGRPG